ncbi:hypothetical protein FKO01_20735 [Mesorhizobium sp. B2-3-3]|nr:hypothetical protein FKO01_20735 [Mesorhizobium sp. B2-3-3]
MIFGYRQQFDTDILKAPRDRSRREAPKTSKQFRALIFATNIMSCSLLGTFFFCGWTIDAAHERNATTDLAITLSSVVPSPVDKLTDSSAW